VQDVGADTGGAVAKKTNGYAEHPDVAAMSAADVTKYRTDNGKPTSLTARSAAVVPRRSRVVVSIAFSCTRASLTVRTSVWTCSVDGD
jgi:hypothetical protein